MGIVRRRKVDVASDLPDKRIADITVELDDEAGRSIERAERARASGSLAATGRSSPRDMGTRSMGSRRG